MIEWTIEFLSGPAIPVIVILLFAMGVTYLENIFPPAPCDAILVFIGTIVGLGKVSFWLILLFSTVGSTLGFTTMFALGHLFGDRIVNSHRLKFINPESMEKPERWFRKYGYIVIAVNRFMSGTRAVISFFAGMSDLNKSKTLILATISSLIWNGILIFAGMELGENWQDADKYISQYGEFILIAFIAVALFFAIRYYWMKKKKNKPE